MKLSMLVGLGPGHIVLHGDPAPLPKMAQPPIFGPYPLRPNACIDHDATRYGGRPRPRRLCVRWGRHRSPSPRGGGRSHRPMSIVATVGRLASAVNVGPCVAGLTEFSHSVYSGYSCLWCLTGNCSVWE